MKKSILSITLCTVIAFTLALCGAAPVADGADGADGGQIVIEVAHMFAEGDPNTIAVEEGKAYIEEKSGGRITFTIYPNGTYGEQMNSQQAVRMGTLDVFNGGFGSDIYPLAGAIQGPYLFRDYDHWQAFKESDVCSDLVGTIEEMGGHKIVGIGHFGFRQVISTKEITSPDDFNGLKLRVVNAPPYPEAATVLGATGTPIPITDVYMSLQTSVVQATENPLAQIVSMKFDEVAKYLVMTDHMIATQYWMASNKLKDSLSEEDWALFAETWDFIAGRIEEMVEDQENANIELLESNGVTVSEIDKQPFIDRLPEVFKTYPDWEPIYEAVSAL